MRKHVGMATLVAAALLTAVAHADEAEPPAWAPWSDARDVPALDLGLDAPPPASTGGEPRIIYLLYPDGGKLPRGGLGSLCSDTVPAYTCSFGGSEGVMGCKKQIAGHMQKIYADFNVVFTHTKPTATKYDTVIVSAKSPCMTGPEIFGIAPRETGMCVDLGGDTKYAVAYAWYCDTDPVRCAHTISQEHGHMVGLMHTASARDVMNPQGCTACAGFEDADNPIASQMTCGKTIQNSHRLMKERLGAWPGGPKPDPFAAPSAKPDAGGGSGGGGVPDAGPDAGAAGSPPDAGASPGESDDPGDEGGRDLTSAGCRLVPAPGSGAAALALAACLLARSRSRRRARPTVARAATA